MSYKIEDFWMKNLECTIIIKMDISKFKNPYLSYEEVENDF